MTRRGFLKVAGWSSLFTLAGIATVIRGPQLGQVIRKDGRILLIVRNDSGVGILPKRVVSVISLAIVGYAVEDQNFGRVPAGFKVKDYSGSGFAVTTERVASGDLTAVVVSGAADVAWSA